MLRKYLQIFVSFMFVSTFTFGGGYVIVPLMRQKFVDQLGWMDADEMLDMTAIAQATPGSIAVNTALQVGFKVAGVLGAAVALLGTVLPSVVIVSLVSIFYDLLRENAFITAVLLGMQAGVAALICDVSINLCHTAAKDRSVLNYVIMVVAFGLIFFAEINVAFVILGCIALGVVAFVVRRQKVVPVAVNAQTQPSASTTTAPQETPTDTVPSADEPSADTVPSADEPSADSQEVAP